MDPIRILQILPSLNQGSGTARVVINWHRNIDTRKIQFDYLYFREMPINFKQEIEGLGGKVYKLTEPSILRPWVFIKDTLKFFKNHRYKTIHSHITNLNFFYFPIAKLYGVKNIILHAHGIKYSHKFLNGIRNRFMLGCVRPFITHKLACSDKAAEVLFGKNSKFIIINNAVEIAKFKYNPAKREEFRTKLDIENNFVIGHVGRFTGEKNHNFIIDIFLEIYKQDNNAVLMLVGNGPLKEQIEDKVNRLNLEKNVKFIGICNNVSDLYQAMDCFILPSFQEGFPVVAVEAQTSGLPCIFSDVITNKVIICDSIQMSLKDSSFKWAKKISEHHKFNRKDNSKILEAEGFDIKDTTLKIQEIYLKS